MTESDSINEENKDCNRMNPGSCETDIEFHRQLKGLLKAPHGNVSRTKKLIDTITIKVNNTCTSNLPLEEICAAGRAFYKRIFL